MIGLKQAKPFTLSSTFYQALRWEIHDCHMDHHTFSSSEDEQPSAMFSARGLVFLVYWSRSDGDPTPYRFADNVHCPSYLHLVVESSMFRHRSEICIMGLDL